MFVRIDRRRKLPASILLRAMEMSDEEILGHFFETTAFQFKKTDVFMALVSERLRGETMSFDIVDSKGEVIVEARSSELPRVTFESCKKPSLMS